MSTDMIWFSILIYNHEPPVFFIIGKPVAILLVTFRCIIFVSTIGLGVGYLFRRRQRRFPSAITDVIFVYVHRDRYPVVFVVFFPLTFFIFSILRVRYVRFLHRDRPVKGLGTRYLSVVRMVASMGVRTQEPVRPEII